MPTRILMAPATICNYLPIGLTQNPPSGVASPCRTNWTRRLPGRTRLRLHAQTVSQGSQHAARPPLLNPRWDRLALVLFHSSQ